MNSENESRASAGRDKLFTDPEKCHGTICYAEKGRLLAMADKLRQAGFQLRNLADPEGQGTLPEPVIFVVDSAGWRDLGESIRAFISTNHYSSPIIQIENRDYDSEGPPSPKAILPEDFTERQLLVAVREAYRQEIMQREIERLSGMLDRGHTDLQKLIEIGISLSSERDIDRLMEKILREARNVTFADAGSIYIIDKNIEDQKILRFRNTQCMSVSVDFHEFTIKIGPESIAGYVALTGESLLIDDCYQIPDQYGFSINRSFDESNNYRTKSMLTVAMRNQKDEITGVIQLINRKKDPNFLLTSPEVAEHEVIPFDERSRELISALASQAAVALENYILYRDIENLFEGFVQASVLAIESRDPTTCGHSERVAVLTVGTAELVDRTRKGPLKDVTFNKNQIKEIRYASLLHDFGKVGVRENVLLKAKKLYPKHLELIQNRFDIAREIYRDESNRSKIKALLEKGRENYLGQFENIDHNLQEHLRILDEYLGLVVQANEPTVMAEANFSRLEDIARIMVQHPEKGELPLLDSEEYRVLSIPKGSLTPEERREIESHVTHTYHFLQKIPWTGDLRSIPEIAHGHHEMLDGKGYPRGISGSEICIQSRMMAVSDIYDALTAADRPYKPALNPERALDILTREAKEGKLDHWLVELFIEGKIYELVKKK